MGGAVSVIIPTWNGRELLEGCLLALDRQTRRPDEIIVVDNGSVDGTVPWLVTAWPDVRVVALAQNTGFAPAVNRGIAEATGSLLVLLNNDATADPRWLQSLADAAGSTDEAVGFFASKIVSAVDGRVESVGDVVDRAGRGRQRGYGQADDGRFDAVVEVFSACGAAAMYRQSMLARIGGFDDTFFAYYEDLDLGFRALLAGYRGLLVPTAVVYHTGGVTSARLPGLKSYLSTRNAWWLLVKNLPTPLLVPVLGRFCVVSTARLLSDAGHGRLGSALRGHRDGMAGLRRILRARRQARSLRRTGAREVWRAMPSAMLASEARLRLATRLGAAGPHSNRRTPVSGGVDR
ncbi:MAG: glycosyltransferase family 2 protein [Actinomycetes bacterium]